MEIKVKRQPLQLLKCWISRKSDFFYKSYLLEKRLCYELVLFLLTISIHASAQQFSVQGKVINTTSKETLPFVNIVIEGTTTGTTTGIDGHFHIALNPKSVLVFSYVGYTSKTLRISTDTSKFYLVELTEASNLLKAVEVIAGENPAVRIIRLATSNKLKHDPENLASFSYKAYHKFYATAEGEFDSPQDTSMMAKFFKNNYLFMNESFTERKYLKPNYNKEIVTGNRMSGVKDPFFAILATNFQPFSFYKNHISLFDKNYINPISTGSLALYDFQLADTIFRGADTTFIISFEPLSGKTFESLKGILYINSNGYALENVLAEPADPQQLTSIKIQQQYHHIEGHWFPEQLNTEFVLKEYKVGSHTVKYIQRTYLVETQINAPLSKKDFSLVNIEFSPSANHQKEEFWTTARVDSLTIRERNTYALYDSISATQLATLNSMVKLAEAFAIGKFRAGSFYIPVENLFRSNRYEAYRFGIGLQTSERISKLVVVDAYCAYGVKDKAWKYGMGLQFNLHPVKDIFFKFSYAQDILEPGNANFIKNPVTASNDQTLRNFLASRMDSIQHVKLSFNIRPIKFSQASLFIQHQRNNPTYPYTYSLNDFTSKNEFIISEIGIQWRYAFRENYAQIGNTKIITGVAYPQINFTASRALDNVWESSFNFSKVEVRIDYQFLLRALGKTSIQIAGGYLAGDAPYPYLFNAKGSRFSSALFNSFVVPTFFQSMGIYEFVSDRYVYGFLTHNFGRIVGTKHKYFRPELAISQNTGVGGLRNRTVHKELTLQSIENGFFESGVTLSNIVRFKYLNIAYLGFGIGAFYRYGYYSLLKSSDNVVLKLAFNVSL
jgi:hypothetical protein